MAQLFKPLSRDQLAKFLPTQEAVRQWESMAQMTGEDVPTDIATIYVLVQQSVVEITNVMASASQALSELEALQEALEQVQGSPITQIGTLGEQQADAVEITGGSITGLSPALPMASGGTAKALSASNGGIVYTDADSMEVLAPTATAGQVLRSGSNAAPSWSTATYPNTATAGRVLLATGANVIGDGPAPFADGTVNFDAVTPGNVTSLTFTNGILTGATFL